MQARQRIPDRKGKSTRSEVYHAVLVQIQRQTKASSDRLLLHGRLSDGRNFGLLVDNFLPKFFVPQYNLEQVQSIISQSSINSIEKGWKSMSGKSLLALVFKSQKSLEQAHASLRSAGIACYEGDIKISQQFLIEKGISLCFCFSGEVEQGKLVDLRCINPEFLSAKPNERDCLKALRIIAIDIETSEEGEIRCISIAAQPDTRIILTQNRGLGKLSSLDALVDTADDADAEDAANLDASVDISEFLNEAELLRAFSGRLHQIDPDIISGWNVISFDMAKILQRMARLGIDADLGRSRQDARFLAGNKDQPDHIDIPGRQVIDAMRLHRMHPRYFESYSLESVAKEVLGRSKRESFADGEKMQRLHYLWENDALNFLYYCLEDAVLVLDLLDATGLLDLTLRRSMLCGTTIGRSWGSVHSFDQLYISALHTQKIAAPDLGVDRLVMDESPGGTIIQPESGLYKWVILLDFKGLYPSIIRTFGIDPLAHAMATSIGQSELKDGLILCSPNGTKFVRGHGILPEILTNFYDLREQAKRAKDEASSYALKILANSFYGVLGTPTCRFAGSDLSTSITAFAKEILHWTRDFASEQGYRAVYGDTDSLFLIPPQNIVEEKLFSEARRLCKNIDDALSAWVTEKYNVESFLEIEFECLFAPLYIPPLKSVASKKIQTELQKAGLPGPLGRAKNYAGFAYSENGYSAGRYEFCIKGMEAVRSDWTQLARRVQGRVLEALLGGAKMATVRKILIEIMRDIQSPKNIDLLVISKRLSKNPSEYKGGKPPHVRAALIAERMQRRNQQGSLHNFRLIRKVSYIMTKSGPEPLISFNSDKGGITRSRNQEIDIGWYVERQIMPVLNTINRAAPFDLIELMNEIYNPESQLSLMLE